MNMTNETILQIAMEQSAIDANCRPEDFLREENVITVSKPNPSARKYLKLPHACNLISYGGNIVATISEEYRHIVSSFINKYPAMRCFETPNLHVLDDAFLPYGFRACFMAKYFLPDMRLLKALPCDYEERIMTAADFGDLYTKEWSSALCDDRKELDVLGVGAYDAERLVGLAACSADCDTMWQMASMYFLNTAEKESHRL